MKSAYQSICRLLASSGYHDRDIAEFLDKLLRMGPTSVLSDIRDLRHLPHTSSPRHVFDVPTDRFVPPPSETALKIERLLVHDVGMSKTTAIEHLSKEILLRFPNLQIPPESRKGFRSWLMRLSTLVPEKELLHVATSIRNRSVQDSPTDWRLK